MASPNLPRAEADVGPGGGEQHHDSDLSPRQVLLMAKVLIGRDEHIVAFVFRQVGQCPVVLVRPAFLCERVRGVLL